MENKEHSAPAQEKRADQPAGLTRVTICTDCRHRVETAELIVDRCVNCRSMNVIHYVK